MSVVAIMRVKDEADIIGPVVSHLLGQVDHVVVQDNDSGDDTVKIATDLGAEVLHDSEVGYYQSAAMSKLAVYAAHEHGAAIVVPVDADEIWYSPHGRIADVLAEHPHGSIFRAALYDHVATAQDLSESDPVQRIGWRRRERAPLWKVAVQVYPRVTIHQGNHGASYGETVDDLLVVRHFPYRSVEQFVSKVRNGAAAYAATDLPESTGKHWRDYGRLLDSGGPDAISEVFYAWFHSAAPEQDPALIYDPAPVACPQPS